MAAALAIEPVQDEEAWDVLRRLVASGLNAADAVKALRAQRNAPDLVESLLRWCAESATFPDEVARERVTPELAARWLEANTRNRSIRPSHVEKYARDVRDGRWAWTGDSIKFDCDGVLLDGQHRLSAIVKAGKAVDLLIVRGLAPEAQFDIDQVIARKVSDVFNILQYPNGLTLAGILRVVANWDRGHRWDVAAGGDPVSQSEQRKLLEENPELEDIARRARSRDFHETSPRLTPQLVGLCMWLFERISKTDADVFFERLAKGTGLTETDPVYLLRKNLKLEAEKERSNRMSLDLAVIITAWNMHRTGATGKSAAVLHRKKFTPSPDKPRPPFPEPI